MDLYLCVPGGKPIGALHDQILELGFDGVRVDIPDDHVGATDVLREFAERPHVKGILLLAGGHMRRGHPREGGPAWKPGELISHVNDTCVKMRDLGLFTQLEPPAIEIGNEPDLADDAWKNEPSILADTFRRCYDVVRRYSDRAPVLCPSVSNLNERGLKYLRKMVRSGLPLASDIAVHRYPNGTTVDIAHRGFSNRAEEKSALLEAAGGRTIWITETGMREGPHRTKERDDHYLTEEEVADQFESEIAFWAGLPQVQALCWYGLNDGPDRRNELHTYGIRRLDGTWKPVAQRVAAVKARLEARH